MIKNCVFPTKCYNGRATKNRSNLLEGAQAYRSLQAHLENLHNTPIANLMRSLELTTERQDESGLNILEDDKNDV